MAKLFLIILLILSPVFCSASVVINEIAWMGTETSYNNEWIELYNDSDSDIILDEWKLISEDGSPEINLQGQIPAKGFFLLERTDDETIPNITADMIYKGSLNNDGEYLKLIDNQGTIIDEIDCSTGWLAGDNKNKQTMERILNGWQTSQEPGGSPKQLNKENIPESDYSNKENIVPIKQENIQEEPIPEPEITAEVEQPRKSNPLIFFLTAFIIALASAIIVLFLKRKTQE